MRFSLVRTCRGWRLGARIGFVGLAIAGLGLGYPSNDDIGRELQRLTAGRPDLIQARVLARSGEGREVWLVRLGRPTAGSGPAMLAVAGLDGNDLLGSASLLGWAQALAEGYDREPAVRDLLDATTIYILPRLNPDAATGYFARPQVERTMDLSPVDEDHDGLKDEDGPDDLDGDGRIAWMRVKDPEGEYQPDPGAPRLLIKADAAKGERGGWKLLPEGRDDDGDEAWNEDGLGGVHFNRNFPCNYRFFGAGAGLYPMSEEVTRKLADFVVAHPEIGLVFTFGSVENLLQTPKGEAPKRPPTGVHEGDVPYLRELGASWREALGLKKELSTRAEPGSFADWIYYHRGRLALAAQAWSPAIQTALPEKKKEEAKPEPGDRKESADAPEPGRPGPEGGKPPGGKEGDGDGKGNPEDRAFLKWVEEHAPGAFIEWRVIEHPDFPGRTVEVGGWGPFARSNPPEAHVEDWVKKHTSWLTSVAQRLPRISVRDVKVKALGHSVYDIVVQVENVGYLPTVLAQGELTREVFPTRVELNVAPEAMLTGKPRATLPAIPGSGGMREARFIVNGGSLERVTVTVVSMLGGSVSVEVPLEERN